MILVSQDGFKAFNMAYIKAFFIYEDKFGKVPTLTENNEKHEYFIWVDAHTLCKNEEFFYSIGEFKTLEDAQNVFNKLTRIKPLAEGTVVKILEKDVEFSCKNCWTGEIEKC